MLKNITFSADPDIISAARAQATANHTTLNAVFREWIEAYVKRAEDRERHVRALDESTRRISAYFRMGKKPTRDELNER